MSDLTIRLTTAQAIIRYLANQFIVVDGKEMRLCGGGFAVINTLQNTSGNQSFNNLLADCPTIPAPYVGWTTQGHTWWECGTPQISDDPKVTEAHLGWEASRHLQRKGV